MLLLQMAWRSLWRNRRRSILVIAAIGFAVTLAIVRLGFDDGTFALSLRSAVRSSTGYVQIQKIGYNDNPTLQKSFTVTPEIESAVKSDPLIEGSSPRIQAGGLISYRNHSLGAMIMGIEPRTESLVTDFPEKINEGRFLDNDTTADIVVGYKLLRNLGAHVGDSVVVLGQGFDGILGNMFVRIVGTFKTGSDEFDRTGAFMAVPVLQNFLAMGNNVNALALSVGNPADVERITRSLDPVLKPLGLVAVPWQELLPQMRQTIAFSHAAHLLFLIILFTVVGFGILNALVMSVTERFREFGVMLSIGMSNTKLAITVAVELFFMIVIGFVSGNAVGAGINYYFMKHPIVIGGNVASYVHEWGFQPIVPLSLSPGIFVTAGEIVLILSLAAAVYPLWRVLRLEPLKGIRYT
ncbi:MAG: FtsX-like permease family protein [Bacteroidetes bacterium]|nr:FtsX-like permease family protein [Bacteroidota bacterium]